MRISVAFTAAALLLTAPALAQNPLTQLGLTEVRARELTGDVVRGASSSGLIDGGVRQMFLKLPGSARGTVTTAMWAWAKTYVSSPAFKSDYAKARTEAMPQPTGFNGTVDEELKATIDEQMKQFAEARKSLAQVPPEQRAAMEAALKQQEAMLQSAEFKAMTKQTIEGERADRKASDSVSMQYWRDAYPADPQVLVARRLREFLAMCTHVDFTAKTEIVDGVRVFSNAAYEKKPRQWKDCFRAGPEAVNAARAAAAAWLKQVAP